MKYCVHCGNQITGEAVVCVKCGCAVNGAAAYSMNKKPAEPEPDRAEPGLIVLSVLIPVVGIVLWALKHGETPKAAKTYGVASLITIGATIALAFFSYLVIAEIIYGFIEMISRL